MPCLFLGKIFSSEKKKKETEEKMSGGGNRNDALETISAAASAIASADDRVPQATTTPKRRWWSRWSVFLCFGSSKHGKRIGHSVLVPEPTAPTANPPAPLGYPARPSVIALPFVAPPSSPASFLQSEPHSAMQSPVGLLSFSPIPSNVYYSPCNHPSVFAIGPYAHETQLVSPPAFSTYNTEPSTAPITPPPESIHLTTPSSPEVPFAQLFNQRIPASNNYEFQFYQLPPGSPLGQLISPSSVVSGSGPASPFTDGEMAIGNPRFPQFPICEPPKLLSPGKLSSLHVPETHTIHTKGHHHHEPNHRVSSEEGASHDRNAEHVIRCVEQKLRTTFPEASQHPSGEAESEERDRTEHLHHHQSASLGSVKEFNFRTEEKQTMITDEDGIQKNNWSFFPVIQQPGTIS
ncbi:PREDICTED: uncharacterized protein LOC104809380 [Tarenaya hassleriana]|uniref:uncharacterized protein LOC104809380 n=1 Tax=Tarenaya hassleriana TaxID=28532 RepID=UPI00053C760F|nr:PREDICTED: uncharacterized protein LOC104809380 [Tarenaya hassleriana]